MRIERDTGVVIDAPSWVLDAAHCRLFDLGGGRASLDALFELSSVLTELEFRRSFGGDATPSEAKDDRFFDPKTTFSATPKCDHAAIKPAGPSSGDRGVGATAADSGDISGRTTR